MLPKRNRNPIQQEFDRKPEAHLGEFFSKTYQSGFFLPQASLGDHYRPIKGFKKDVLTKIHGGGATDRKRKLLEKQKKGKARSKQFGRVEIPQEAFIGVLKISKEK